MYVIGINSKYYWDNTNDNVQAVIELESLPVMCMSFNCHWLENLDDFHSWTPFGKISFWNTSNSFETPDKSKCVNSYVIIGYFIVTKEYFINVIYL